MDVIAAVVTTWTPRSIAPEAAAFARQVVEKCSPSGPSRARALLWAAGRLAEWGHSVGLPADPEVLFHPSVIERFVRIGMATSSMTVRRSVRTNLRFVARHCAIAQTPEGEPLSRSRSKAPYAPTEIEAYFALADAQPTEARRQRLVGLLCLGLGAGLQGPDLRLVTGRHVTRRAGATVVVVEGPRARVVPVLGRYSARLWSSAAFAGDNYLCGGSSPARKNLTANLLDHLAGGADLPRIDVSRLRSTWLAGHLVRLGVPELLRASGVHHSQRVFDLAVTLDGFDEEAMIELLS